jgi:16S rRNA C967 or C1407 C5-methylase (RsmB/RsmF family)
LIKQNSYNWSSLGKIIDPEKLKNLEGLQRKLIFNGFRILKPGGILVYSTCSFFKSQNEDIVSWLVQTCDGQAVIEPIPDYETFPLAPTVDPTTPCLNSEYMIRFSPKHSNTSGLFIARIKKLW